MHVMITLQIHEWWSHHVKIGIIIQKIEKNVFENFSQLIILKPSRHENDKLINDSRRVPVLVFS